MCILFIYTDPDPPADGYRLVVASNRDEFYGRPAQFVKEIEHVLGGRDMESDRSGGMWLGVSLKKTNNSKFRFAALLNVTGEQRKESKGRGFIVANYLHGEVTADEYMNGLESSGEVYNAFNFVTVDISGNGEVTTHHCSNVPVSREQYRSKQFLGFGNTTPKRQLTKVKIGTEHFKDIVNKHNSTTDKQDLVAKLLQLLKSEESHLPDGELERRQPSAYEYLSCIFVKMVDVGYGTRAHSIVLVDHNWNIEFHEVAMDEPVNPESPVWKTSTIKARL